jgi:hypothetical protein
MHGMTGVQVQGPAELGLSEARLRLLRAAHEAFADCIFGRTHAPASLPEYLEFEANAKLNFNQRTRS